MQKKRFERIAELCPHDILPGGAASLRRYPRTLMSFSRIIAAMLIFGIFPVVVSAAPGVAAAAGDGTLIGGIEHQGTIGVSAIVALVLFTCVTTLLHLTARNRWTAREALLNNQLAEAKAQLERARVFLSAERQVVIAWGAATAEPEIEGELTLITDAPVARRVLGFGSWLPPALAQQMDAGVERLRASGDKFVLPLLGLNGRRLEAEGRAIAGRAILRIRDVSGDRLELTILRERTAKIQAELETTRTLLDTIPDPVWSCDADEKLVWVNQAYARAVEAREPQDAVARGLAFMDQQLRVEARAVRQPGSVWRKRAPAIVAQARHVFDISEIVGHSGISGMARDITDAEQARTALERQMQAHARTLDQLPTAVAIFDSKRRLIFRNTAYQQLWSLDAKYLDQMPLDEEILDRLRASRRLPEQADFRAWKRSLYTAYQSDETTVHTWYLPDSRTLHVVANPNGQGGVTYLFDDISERSRLESQFNALSRVQSETLDNLREGVAVFGSNGRLKLANPAFGSLWQIDDARLNATLHIDAFTEACMPLYTQADHWRELRQVVAGVSDARTGLQCQMVRRDGMIIDCTAAPLPDGATLITFIDTTASFNVEKALTERGEALKERSEALTARNEALTQAENLRADFVHHVSYELRSPLNSIIGFTQMLADEIVGPLNAKQKEYAADVSKSSTALLAIIDQILDLASVDRDAMELKLGDVDVAQVMAGAAEGVQDRIAERMLNLRIVVTDNVGSFHADAQRLRQVLFALLSNAIGFSEPGQTVVLAAMRREGEIIIKVTDQGRGIAPELLDQIWDRFKTFPQGSRHRGVGLGLSVVRALVEAHKGRVAIQSAPGEGTVVTCAFPAPVSLAAEPPVQTAVVVNKD